MCPLPHAVPTPIPRDASSLVSKTFAQPPPPPQSHLALVLGKMVHGLAKMQSSRLLKHVIRCYLRLSDNSRAREALRQCLPEPLRDGTFNACLKDDANTRQWLAHLMGNLEGAMPAGSGAPLQPPSQQ